jgi:hypothetical protein
MAAPSLYKPEYAELARNYCLLGATDAQLAQFFNTSDRTIRTWKDKHADFAAALAHGKQMADAKVAGALYDNALGGNVVAQIFWMKNRQNWRDKVDHEMAGKDGGPLSIEIVRFGAANAKDPAA